MPKRTVVTVSTSKEGWKISGGPAKGEFASKQKAIAAGKKVAKAADLGQLRVKGQDGKIQTEYTYGKDPRNIKG